MMRLNGVLGQCKTISFLLCTFFLLGCSDDQKQKEPDYNEFIVGINEFISQNPEYRTYDGRGNNVQYPELGMAMTPLLRFPIQYYQDRQSIPTPMAVNPRVVSISMHGQSVDAITPNHKNASDYLWLWGQFVDHDIGITEEASPEEEFNIHVPTGDTHFDPFFTGTEEISLKRSEFVTQNGVRKQLNEITAFIDASQVYGSEEGRSMALRKKYPDGSLSPYLKTSSGNFLPYNTDKLMNAPADRPDIAPESLFVAGDVRANENVALTAMHTIFVREHNYTVGLLLRRHPNLSSESLFQIARAIVAAEIQAITYREFLPVLLGKNALTQYRGYNPAVNPGAHVFFTTVAFRLGHSMVSQLIPRYTYSGTPSSQGSVRLRDAFFENVPSLVRDSGIDPFLIGLNYNAAQEIDLIVIDELRNFLFGPPGAGGLDLAALNIQRSRDHGLPGYNESSRLSGLLPATSFGDLSEKSWVQSRLASVYSHPSEIDAWTGGLAEDHVQGALVGPLFFSSIRDQFTRLRDGDRFWYENYLPPALRSWVESSTLSQIIRRNTQIGDELSDDIFFVNDY